MNIGVLGTGIVGEAIASALIKKKHRVMMGSRTPNNEKANAWVTKAGELASQGSFADAVNFADLIIICLNGGYVLDVIDGLDPKTTNGKIVMDITNPIDFSQGMAPRIIEHNKSGFSLGEEIQNALPNAYVVKTLNTVNYKLMVDARLVNDGDHNLFVCGNNADAKNKVMHFLVDNFHWRPDCVIDLGGIESARTAEAIVPFWMHVWKSIGTPLFNIKIVRQH